MKRFFLLFGALSLLSSCAYFPCRSRSGGLAAQALAAALPREFAGLFKWRADDQTQAVVIRFSAVAVTAVSQVEALGVGRYDVHGNITDIRVRALIDAETQAIEIWESNPSRADFVIDGSHQGRLSADLQTISAVWTSRSGGGQGDLTLAGINN